MVICAMASRTALTKFRTSAHQLRIETGRYQNLEENKRTCQLCTSNELESEIYFLIKCNFFEDKRKTISNFVNNVVENFDKFSQEEQLKELLTTNNEVILKKLS